ncbi:hypothetical protein LTR56_022374 [Elasticomyces elasticus]|nr:hypothetical protein LTR56_022374 [Elasticomyces elasticus]KAK3627584.1 hypothetical protein LTR22_022680 [Elasticomyces elasticus]KAK4907749.1 hypothetical protein LTR49_023280 [Elasticomyces elasticus]KAK5742151.1 hypothetical protein LTS12_024330 [Elasticomyces elasticus]
MSARSEAQLTDEQLLNVADHLSKLDKAVCQWIYKYKFNQQKVDPEAARQIAEIDEVLSQYKEVAHDRSVFHKSYLEDRALLCYWGQAPEYVNCMFAHPKSTDIHDELKNDMAYMETKARQLDESLQQAYIAGVLTERARLSVREKWTRLDNVLDVFVKQGFSRTLPTWSAVSARMSASARAYAPSATHFSLKLWATYILMIFITVPTFIKAYLCSQHIRGTTSDPDFWFLLQSTAAQLISLAFGMPPIRNTKNESMLWWLVPTVLAGIATFIAPVLYIFMPTEWSSYCQLTGAAAQIFLLLQVA